MDTEKLLGHIERLVKETAQAREDYHAVLGVRAQVAAFLAAHAGTQSPFLKMVDDTKNTIAGGPSTEQISAALHAFKAHVSAGLLNDISPTRQAQIEVVSDFLEQANFLLGSKNIHPAAPITLIGACLEEFLRNWINSLELDIGTKTPSIDLYSQVLAAAGMITKLDIKDLSVWAALRNHAAHGQFEEVSEKRRASMMLEGVGLFMRKYGTA